MFTTSAHPIRRGAAFWVACSAAVGGALIVLARLPQLLRLDTAVSIILAVLALACLVSVLVAAAQPGKVWPIGAAGTTMVILWLSATRDTRGNCRRVARSHGEGAFTSLADCLRRRARRR